MTLKLIGLVGVFVALPVVLYGQFESADAQRRELVARGIQHRTWLIAQAISPMLDQPDGPRHSALNSELQRYNDGRTILRLMFSPAGSTSPDRFYYIASSPEATPDQIGPELERLAEHGILQRLSESCEWSSSVDLRFKQPDGREEIMTSLLPIQSRWGCWVLISAHPTSEFLNVSIGRSYWQTEEIRIAAGIYVAFALLAVLMAWSVWRNLHHFRRVASEIRHGRAGGRTFVDRNVVPELTSVAADFDQLVADLRKAAPDIRQTAEDNAHSFKAPICTIQSALEPIKRVLPADNERSKRAVVLIESSIRRLHALVNAAQQLDYNTADLIDAPRRAINLTNVIADVLFRYRETIAERRIRLVRVMEDNIIVHAAAGVLDVVFENILDNAISFSPPDSTITVSLARERKQVLLRIDDEGPGIDPDKVGHIFDRYFSLRPHKPEEEVSSGKLKHSGLGLWIVRRNVEALGGQVSAMNRITGGLSIQIILPAAE
ncbi:HAMP domain-containing sensor histidine kinase [uncultured Ferrovibrio sp.]|uniref:sensor histidine kinase n=1 Tax=uncultured Ferrovibrio sp. TaxID=1576913 RepID=UPI00261C4672|nr:HAMP domain-containing sensor histidine kinase [uncultured Ferrovibrio sp.]